MKYNQQTRRYFIKSAIIGLIVGAYALWDKAVITQIFISQKKKFSLSFDQNRKINFYDDFIIINEEGSTKVLSSRCTHLGCKIDKYIDDKFLCPCHGSAFDIEGNCIKGPAIVPLKKLEFQIDSSNTQITIIT